MITKTTYIDKDGNEKVGYIKDGKTYTDEALTTRVGVGSIVKTGGGDYYMGSTGGAKVDAATGDEDSFYLNGRAYRTYYNQNGDAFMDEAKTQRIPSGAEMYIGGAKYVNDSDFGIVPTLNGAMQTFNNMMASNAANLEAALNAQKQASDVRLNQRLKAIKERERQVLLEKREADRQSYNAYLQAINPYGARAESLARLGLSNSGFSETSLTKLGVSYQQALAGNEKARAEAMAELARLADEARAEGNREQFEMYAEMYKTLANMNMEQAKMNAQFGMEGAKMLRDKQVRAEDIERDDRIRAEDIAREDQIRAEGYEREDRIRAEENAREDQIRAEENAREDRIRAEENARADARAAASSSRRSSGGGSSGSSEEKEDNRVYNPEFVEMVINQILNRYLTVEKAAQQLGMTVAEVEAMLEEFMYQNGRPAAATTATPPPSARIYGEPNANSF